MREKVILITLFLFISARTVHASNEVLLKSRCFTPQPGISADAKGAIEAIPERAHVLMQLHHIPTIKERKALEHQGVKLLSYIPNNAWFASIPSDKAGEIAALSNVRAIGKILPEDKISPPIRQSGINEYSLNQKGQARLVVIFFEDVSLNEACDILANPKYGGVVIGGSSIMNTLVIYLPQDFIYKLAKEDSIKWIDQHYKPRIANDGIRAAIGVDTVQAPPYNLTGTDVIAGQWDGGCVDDTHDDLIGRVTQRNCAGPFPYHATHVAGTMLGDGTRSEAEGGTPLQWRGMATEANVISYLWWEDVNDLEMDYNEAINSYGIDLSTNSWIYLDPNAPFPHGWYDIGTAAIDEVITGALGKRISIIWAAGNERPDYCDRDEYDCIPMAGTAKNTITVGATNSNDDSMTGFSSWGPTDDGRIKPDVVAPGCQIGGDGGITSTIPEDTYISWC
ncbi:MAG: S8 family serine peptidase, partial [Planctomycetota bacterium]|nr:S8 family serine peptidase [Planctomycetota bacterium]